MHGPNILELIQSYQNPHPKLNAALKMLTTFENISYIGIAFNINELPCTIKIGKDSKISISFIEEDYILCPPNGKTFNLNVLKHLEKYFDEAPFRYYKDDKWHKMNL